VVTETHTGGNGQRVGGEATRVALLPSGPVLLETKLHTPTPGPSTLTRPHLLAALSAGAGKKLTLVRAPAGFGKTTLLASWCAAERPRRPAGWVHLDQGDNDPLCLLTYMVEALHRIDPAVGRHSLAALRAPGVSLLDAVLPLLLNELAALTRPAILVLDDYHMVESQECHLSISFLVEHLPSTLQLVLSTRSDPPLPLARLRARDELRELHATDLRFAEEEAAVFLNDRAEVQLSPGDLATLHQRTEGWPAGLQLAALTLKGDPDPGARVATFTGSHRHVIDYLGTELLLAQPHETQAFLRHTSVLQRLSGPLCEAVTQNQNSAEVLRQLDRANLFVVSLDDRREWYRYHHLFGELLQHELAASEPELAPVLHRRASVWYRDSGFPEEAIHHAIAAGEVAEVGELIARHWISYVDRWRIVTVRSWLRALPEEVVRADPVLTLVSAWIALSFEEPAELDHWLAIADRIPSQGPLADGTPSLELGIAALLAVSGFHGLGAKLDAARRMLALQPDPASLWRQTASWALGYGLYLSGKKVEAQAAVEEAIRIGRSSPVRTTMIRSLALLGLIADDQGRADDAEALSRQALELTEDEGLAESPVVGAVFTLLGRIRARRGDVRGARAAHEHAFALQRYPVERFHALVELLPIRHADDDDEGVQELLVEAGRLEATGIDFGVLPRRMKAVSWRFRTAEKVAGTLSAREVEVLRLLCGPLSLRDIGKELFISHDTVKSHVKAIYHKLGVPSRKEAVAVSRKLGLVP
jgi:LuxR family transcriptional regulator, maltose regulon positive regulatory protein